MKLSIRYWAVTTVLAGILMIGCGGDARNAMSERGEAAAGATSGAGVAGTPAGAEGSSGAAAADGVNGAEEEAGATSPATRGGVVLFLGTSLTAGLGVDLAQSFPMLIGGRIAQAGLPFQVVNAGVSGETSAGAVRRIDWLLRQPFDVVVLETGANDMLRGTSPQATEANIQTIIDRIRAQRPEARIVLAGMRAAPNLGPQYVRQFESIFPRVATRNRIPLIPFLLEGVAAVPQLNQGDGIHPNVAGHRQVAENVWETVEPVLREAAERR